MFCFFQSGVSSFDLVGKCQNIRLEKETVVNDVMKIFKKYPQILRKAFTDGFYDQKSNYLLVYSSLQTGNAPYR